MRRREFIALVLATNFHPALGDRARWSGDVLVLITVEAKMPDSEYDKLSVLVPSDLARLVREAVDGERYVVESDVVIDALQDWQIKRQIQTAKVQRLRELIQEGIDSGAEPMADDEFERLKREGRAPLAARNPAE